MIATQRLKNEEGNYTFLSGKTLPTGPGYSIGCIFVKMNATTLGTEIYMNVGSTLSASFQSLSGLTGLSGHIQVPVKVSQADANVLQWVFYNKTGQNLQVIGISEIHTAAATDVTANLDLRNVSTVAAPSGGVSLLASLLNLKTVANTPVEASLSATPANLVIADGSRIGMVPPAALTTYQTGLILIRMNLV